MDENPLVTVILLSYNSEKFINEALYSVLAQNYHPLQILVSDDCSTDQSPTIINKLVAEYTGPHQVIVNHNPQNLGLGNNVNRSMEIADGELIVEADGDDISLVDRVSNTVRAWVNNKKNDLVFCGASRVVNEVGDFNHNLPKIKNITFDQVVQPQKGQWIYGGSLAWHRSLFRIFGPLRNGVVSQDKAIGFRSLLLGKEVQYIEKPLIKYRIHDHNISSQTTIHDRLRQKVATFGSYLQDLEKAESLGLLSSQQNIDEIHTMFVERFKDFKLRFTILDSNILSSILKLLLSGNKLSLQQKKNLFLKRLKGNEKDLGWIKMRKGNKN